MRTMTGAVVLLSKPDAAFPARCNIADRLMP
jgi:hypothetical protein